MTQALTQSLSPPDPQQRPTEAVFRALVRTCGLMRHTMHPFFARFGISGSQWGVLLVLHRAEAEGSQALRLTDISDRLLIRPPSVTGVVERLTRMGLVGRAASAADQRAKPVALTAAGHELVQRVVDNHGEYVKTILGALSPQEQQQLLALLDRLGVHLEALSASQDPAPAATEPAPTSK